MSHHYALPHLFQLGDLEPHTAASVAGLDAAQREIEAGLESDDDLDRELYGEEEGIRVLYQRSFLGDD